MRILVTGGCGFIGSNFVRQTLEQNPDLEVVNLDKLTYAGNLANLADLSLSAQSRHTFVKGDIADRPLVFELMTSGAFDAVVHFAAESHVDRSIADAAPFISTNLAGTQVLLDCARLCAVPRFVHVSTDEVYGSLGPQGSFTEDCPLTPNSPYAASKAGSDLLVRAAFHTFGQDVVITRCSNNYGPYQFPEKLIPLMIDRARQDQPLPVYGQGLNVRDWIHVYDHCQGVWQALTRGRAGQAYNFGGNAEKTNLEVVSAILEQLGKPRSLIRFVQDRPGHDWRYAMNFDKAAAELGFAPQYDFQTGLADTINWYAEHREWVEQVKSGAYLEFEQAWYRSRV